MTNRDIYTRPIEAPLTDLSGELLGSGKTHLRKQAGQMVAFVGKTGVVPKPIIEVGLGERFAFSDRNL